MAVYVYTCMQYRNQVTFKNTASWYKELYEYWAQWSESTSPIWYNETYPILFYYVISQAYIGEFTTELKEDWLYLGGGLVL